MPLWGQTNRQTNRQRNNEVYCKRQCRTVKGNFKCLAALLNEFTDIHRRYAELSFGQDETVVMTVPQKFILIFCL